LIEFQNVSFGYDGARTIRDVSFRLEKGEFAAIIGENGAGKTTLSKLCNGLLKPVSGSVTVNGMDTKATRVSRIARSVGFLFQNPDRQICRSTIREEILFGLELTVDDPAERSRRLAATLADFGKNMVIAVAHDGHSGMVAVDLMDHPGDIVDCVPDLAVGVVHGKLIANAPHQQGGMVFELKHTGFGLFELGANRLLIAIIEMGNGFHLHVQPDSDSHAQALGFIEHRADVAAATNRVAAALGNGSTPRGKTATHRWGR
jgi:ABC-type sugar transport system ATPase subunit